MYACTDHGRIVVALKAALINTQENGSIQLFILPTSSVVGKVQYLTSSAL